jgi:hypothetical protein
MSPFDRLRPFVLEALMRIRLLVLLAIVAPAVASAQEKLPPDIHPVTLSRLPPVTPADLDADGQKLLAARTNVTPAPGPGHVTIYSPKVAEGLGAIGRALGVPRGDTFRFGVRNYQLIVLSCRRSSRRASSISSTSGRPTSLPDCAPASSSR